MLTRKSTLAVSALVAFQLVTGSVFAKDFALRTLSQAKNPTFDLADYAGKTTYYDLMHSKKGIGKAMKDAGSKGDNEDVLRDGGGVSVKLSKNNFNVHINFPNSSMGGRSYGWTSGQVGDWSDKMYLDNLAEVISEKSEKDLRGFYKLIIEMLGASNADGETISIEQLNRPTQRVAANFLAIYTAEEYRAMVPQPARNWDDAILEVTLLSAFHSGQAKFTKFYIGDFTSESKVQNPGVYSRFKPGPKFKSAKDKEAEMNDYWQFSANPDSKRSGINLTRGDFEKLGQVITTYERDIERNSTLKKIEKVVGKSDNVIKAISQYFVSGKATVDATEQLSEDVADFLMDVRDHADDITAWEANGEKE